MARKPALPGVDRRQSILDAALVVFAEEGFEAATNKAIAEHAGVNQGLIYFYFASKADVCFATFAYHTKTVIQQMDAVFVPDTTLAPAESLTRVLEGLFAVLSHPPATYLVRIMHQITAGHTPEGELSNQKEWQAIGGLPRYMQEQVQKYLEACMARGDFVTFDAGSVAYVLIRTLMASASQFSSGDQSGQAFHNLAGTLARLYCYGLLPREEQASREKDL